MNQRILISMLAAVLLTGCATRERNPLAARRTAYERLLRFIEPGMTRRQLYALLPPARTPTMLSSLSTGSVELHPLDRDFSMEVQYRLPGRSTRFTRNAIDHLLFGNVHVPPPGLPSKENADDELIGRPTVYRLPPGRVRTVRVP